MMYQCWLPELGETIADAWSRNALSPGEAAAAHVERSDHEASEFTSYSTVLVAHGRQRWRVEVEGRLSRTYYAQTCVAQGDSA
jgi:hypothetical protein